MSTVGALIDRTFRTYLEPPDYQPAASRLQAPMDAVTQNISITAFEVPEDENLMRVGSIIEVGSELMRVLTWDTSALTGTVQRNVDGTTATTHAVDARLKLSPRFPRQSVFEAVRDGITALYPMLWTTNTELLASVGLGVYAVTDELAVEIVEMNPESMRSPVIDFDGRIVEYHDLADGRAIITNVPTEQALWVRYRRRMGVATSEADTLAALGVESVWEVVVMSGAAADVMVGRDLPRSQTEWVGQALEAENVPIGTSGSVAVRLAQYRDYKLDQFNREMKGEDSNRIRVHMTDPLAQVVR